MNTSDSIFLEDKFVIKQFHDFYEFIEKYPDFKAQEEIGAMIEDFFSWMQYFSHSNQKDTRKMKRSEFILQKEKEINSIVKEKISIDFKAFFSNRPNMDKGMVETYKLHVEEFANKLIEKSIGKLSKDLWIGEFDLYLQENWINKTVMDSTYKIRKILPIPLKVPSIENQVKQKLPDFPDSFNLMDLLKDNFHYETILDYDVNLPWDAIEILKNKSIRDINHFFDSYFKTRKEGMKTDVYNLIEEYRTNLIGYADILERNARIAREGRIIMRTIKRKCNGILKMAF